MLVWVVQALFIPLWFLTLKMFQSNEASMSMLQKLREERGLSQQQLAELAGTSQPQINRLEKSKRTLSKAWAERLSPHLGISAEKLLFPVLTPGEDVEIVGMVGADTEGQRVYGTGQSGLGWVERIPGTTKWTVAVIVRGTSMSPYAADGAIIFYDDRRDPPSDDMLGEVVIVGLSDDRVLLKRLLRGSPNKPGCYDLESFNGERMPDQEIEWAAFVSAVIPPRQARRIIRDFSN
jgi:transcriptional regulator with XRE-family HTH domain